MKFFLPVSRHLLFAFVASLSSRWYPGVAAQGRQKCMCINFKADYPDPTALMRAQSSEHLRDLHAEPFLYLIPSQSSHFTHIKELPAQSTTQERRGEETGGMVGDEEGEDGQRDPLSPERMLPCRVRLSQAATCPSHL